MSYKQLTQEQRYQLYRMNEMSLTHKDIALILGVSASTISRELKRNVGQQGRYIKEAHKLALDRRRHKSKPRISPADWRMVEGFLRQDFSPEQVSDWFKRCKKKHRKRYGGVRNNQSLCDRVSIEDRPAIVNKRKRYGDWEVDTVIGRQGGKVLVTLVERKSKLSIMGLATNKTAQAVKETLVQLLSSLSSHVHTLTYDNGPEFAQHKEIDTALKSQGYFARPYCSGDRGLSENTNGLIRQYLPKRSSFDEVPQSKIEWIMERLNNRPRKTLKGRTPNEVFFRGSRIALTT